MTQADSKTIGSGPACDLVLDDSSVSTLHARLELAFDGYLYVNDAGSDEGTFLRRSSGEIRVLRTTLCIGDRIRFGAAEVEMEQLTRLFSDGRQVRLRPRPALRVPMAGGRRAGRVKTSAAAPGSQPRRNPETGQLEEQQRDSTTRS